MTKRKRTGRLASVIFVTASFACMSACANNSLEGSIGKASSLSFTDVRAVAQRGQALGLDLTYWDKEAITCAVHADSTEAMLGDLVNLTGDAFLRQMHVLKRTAEPQFPNVVSGEFHVNKDCIASRRARGAFHMVFDGGTDLEGTFDVPLGFDVVSYD